MGWAFRGGAQSFQQYLILLKFQWQFRGAALEN